MQKLLLLAGAAAALAAPTALAHGRIVHFKLLPQSPVAFGPPTAECPAGTKAVDISSPEGVLIGRQYVCTQAAEVTAEGKLVERNTLVWDFGGGNTIEAAATAVFAFTGDQASFRAAGVVTGGTGAYAGARGRLHARGPMSFEPTGEPRLNVNSIIWLG